MMKKFIKKTVALFLIIMIMINCGFLNIIPSFAITTQEKNEIIERMENEIKAQGIDIAEIEENIKITDWKKGDSLTNKIGNKWSIRFSPYNMIGKKVEKTVKFNECISKNKIPIAGDFILNIINQDGEESDIIKEGLNIFMVSITMYPVLVNENNIKRNTAIGIVIIDLEKEVKSIEIFGKNSVYVGKNIDLEAEITPSDATNKNVTWSSSDKTVATVTNVEGIGRVKGVKAGKAIITATASNGVKDTYSIEVKEEIIEATSIKIAGENSVKVGKEIELTATITPTTTTNKTVTWSSSDKTIATVDSTGKVKGIKKGEATITAKTSNGKLGTYKINVIAEETDKEVLAEKIEIAGENSVKIDEVIELTATITPENTTDKTIIWSSSDEKIATVDSTGKVKGIKEGTVIITATTSNGIKKEYQIEIKNDAGISKIESLKIKGEKAVKVGENITLAIEILPEDATDKTVEWEISDETIASIDENGKVTGIKEGTVIITATSNNGISTTYGINVYENEKNEEIVAQKIKIDGEKSEIIKGKEIELSVNFIPENAENKNITWFSTDPEIAEVDENGKVTGKSTGEVTIIAMTSNMKSASFKINILEQEIVQAESIKINGEKNKIKVGEKIELSSIITPENAINKNVIWLSTNNEIIEIKSIQNGLEVIGKKEGKAVIIAMTNNMKLASYEIEVDNEGTEKIEIESIQIESEKNEIVIGEEILLNIKVTPENAEKENIIWISSNEEIASIDTEGKVTGKKEGTVVIIGMTSNAKMARYEITVKGEDEEIDEIEIDNIEISQEKNKIKVDEEIELKAIIIPGNATDKTVKWESSNEEIAIVDNTGKVTGKKAGNVTIKATTNNNKTAETIIEVEEKENSEKDPVDEYQIEINTNLSKNKIKKGEKTKVDIEINAKKTNSEIVAILMKIDYPKEYMSINILEEKGIKIYSAEEMKKETGVEYAKGTIGIVPEEPISESEIKRIMQLEIEGIKEKENAEIKIKDIVIECENSKIIKLNDLVEKITIEKINEDNYYPDDERNENNNNNGNNNNNNNGGNSSNHNNNSGSNQVNNNNKGEQKDNSVYNDKLAHAGSNIITMTGFILIAISSFVLYRKYKMV